LLGGYIYWKPTKIMKKFLSEIFQDEKGAFSSKRFVGIMCAVSLCATMYHNSFSTVDVAPAPALIQSVAALAFGALGLASADKIFTKKNSD
jgi:hypothetical protein